MKYLNCEFNSFTLMLKFSELTEGDKKIHTHTQTYTHARTHIYMFDDIFKILFIYI